MYFSQTLTPFLIGRVLQGLATCSLGSAGYATIQELYTGVKAIQIISRMAAVAILAPCMGPMIGGWILQLGPWQWIFITVLIGGFISLVGLIYSMPETLHERTAKLSFMSAIRHYKLILSAPSFIAGNLCNGLFWGSLMCWITTAPAIIMNEFHMPNSSFGKLQIPVFGCYFIGALAADRLAARVETKKIISFGILFALVASFLMAAKSFLSTLSFNELLCGVSAFAIGNGLASPPNFRFTVASVPYSMSFKSALFNFNSAGVATLFTFMSSHLYKGNSSIIAYILFFTAIAIAASFKIAIKHYSKLIDS